MARNHLEEQLEVIRNQKELYKQKIRELEKEELDILEVLGVFKKVKEWGFLEKKMMRLMIWKID